MRRRELIAMLGGAAVAWPLVVVSAQSIGKRPLIGVLHAGRSRGPGGPNGAYRLAFLEGMRELGYIVGQNFDLVDRYADGDYSRLGALAAELVHLKPDVIIAAEPPSSVTAKGATETIPIVGALLNDPVRLGLVVSFARPGYNVTGILVTIDGLWTKYLELARELVPSATMIGLIVNPGNPGNATPRRDVEAAGTTAGVKIVTVEARATSEFAPAFQALIGAGVQAVIVGGDALFVSEHRRLAELAMAARLPSVSGTRELTEAGGLASYNVNNADSHHRVAYFVDKILRGAKPADLPVEFPTKLEMIVNLKTAKALGLTIPPTLLARADEVIE